MEPEFSPDRAAERAAASFDGTLRQGELVAKAIQRHSERISRTHGKRLRERSERTMAVLRQFGTVPANGGSWFDLASSYLTDSFQRGVLTLDVLRERGNNDIAHEADGTPPVLIYKYEIVVDGAVLKHPVNYMLLRILPPEGTEIFDWKRPYMIIDPRAGHGAGIGGFKEDSQVGVALRDGHPVYFVAFRPHPEPGQTLADVMRAEVEFIREIARLHPEAPKPIVVGNCQGGWAAMLLAAANADITGPLVINGAPLAYWSGRVGENPMRYNGGLLGGLMPALLFSDLGHGQFDGAHLVSNFEGLNPARNHWGKYFDLYSDVEGGRERFLEFERWWGGFHFMNEAEIRWIVEQLFVGNKLARGEARLEHGRHLDLKKIRSPIIVFASHGDNITPPQQALNWIVDTYADENEIKIRGQRIIYMMHDKVGHLGIFVSSSIANKEHSEVASTMKTIEALAPGLYEMAITDQHGEGVHARFTVSFTERKLDDIRALDDGQREEEQAFAAVDRLSQLGAEAYDLTLRPMVQASITPQIAEALRAAHPARAQRLALSDRNPWMSWVESAARAVTQARTAVPASHPYRQLEQLWSESIEQGLDLMRDMRDACYETMFYGIYSSPAMKLVGRSYNFQRTLKDPTELRFLPEVQAHLLNVSRGGLVEGVIRMLIVLAQARGSVRRTRLERSAQVLTMHEPFASLGSERRAALIHEQTVIVEFEQDKAVETLPILLPTDKDRREAIDVVEFIAGPLEEMEPHTIQALQRFRRTLGLPTLEARPADVAIEAPREPEAA
jgi:pimeloyl-ACP methyl ester carboxylesterase/tellurite resistance protein